MTSIYFLYSKTAEERHCDESRNKNSGNVFINECRRILNMRKNITQSGKIVTAVLAATLAAGLLAGCNGERSKSTEKTKGTTEVSTEVTTEKTEAQTTEAVSTEAETEAQTTEAASSEEDTGTTKAEASTTEAQSEDVSSLLGTYPMDMVFSSGAGGWSTTLTLSEDGSFTGAFSDSEMGERDENDYPNGTVYFCNFSGQFANIKKVNDYTYSMTLDSVVIDKEADRIEDGIRYKEGEPSGMDSGTEIYFYTPDAPVSELPDGFLSWWQTRSTDATTLGCYGIYNKSADAGFFQ